MEPFYNFTLEELEKKLTGEGFRPYRARQVFSWVYKRGLRDFSLMTNISKNQRLLLDKLFSFPAPRTIKKEISQDKTKKFLFELIDKEKIETVLIPKEKRNTLCVSTQVGCRFNCKFCASKIGGFFRNLEVYELVGQFLEAEKKDKITNIVYMGVGEPLDNFKNLVKSIRILTEPAGINFTKRRISLSTCGLADKIRELADLDLGIKISISLHAADDKKRSQLMPINKKYPLAALIQASQYYQKKQGFPVTFEYILVEGCNTGEAEIKKLAKLAKKINAKLNLIPYNEVKANLKPLSFKAIEKIKKTLKSEDVTFTLREARGSDINAACGQLRGLFR